MTRARRKAASRSTTFSSSIEVTRSLTSSFDLDTILRTIIEHMERFIEAELVDAADAG
jgi:hypothetical protein